MIVVSDNNEESQNQDNIAMETSNRNIANSDPGPIELGDIMKSFIPRAEDPMEGKDLNFGDIVDESDSLG